ncbi:MAG TPA: hypothetical protein VK890_09985 [Bacteroidia bacterium]|nr:hypothetical protein [Bacteroidia bacterium]
MNAEDHIAQTIIKQKLDLIRAMLLEMNARHNFNFSLNYSLLENNTKKLIMNEGFVNQNIAADTLESFIAPLQGLLERRIYETNAMAIGKVLVLCANDREQDVRLIHKLQVHERYVVQHIHVEQSQHYFILEGMEHGQAPGYEAARFVILFNSFNSN